MNKLFKTLAVTAFAATASVGAAQADGERYVLVSHAPDSDSWWNTIKNGLALACEQMEVECEYRNPPTGDLADMARIIEQAAASGPDGIITTLADPDVLSGPIRNAVDSGIDVIIINSGTPEQARDIGALMYVGQPEYDAGFAAGQRAAGDGVESFLCVNHYISQPASSRALPGLCRWPRGGTGQPDDRQRAGPVRDPEPGDGLSQRQPRYRRGADPRADLGRSDDPGARPDGAGRRHLFRHLRPGRRHRRRRSATA